MTKKTTTTDEPQYTTTVLTPGLYRLSQRFQHPRADKRRTGAGLYTPDGFAEGTRFTLKVDTGDAPYRHHGLEVLSHGRDAREIIVRLPHRTESAVAVSLDAAELLGCEVESLS